MEIRSLHLVGFILIHCAIIGTSNSFLWTSFPSRFPLNIYKWGSVFQSSKEEQRLLKLFTLILFCDSINIHRILVMSISYLIESLKLPTSLNKKIRCSISEKNLWYWNIELSNSIRYEKYMMWPLVDIQCQYCAKSKSFKPSTLEL